MTRVGVVDLGTNSTRLLVGDVENGRLRELDRRLTITRLGEGVDERRMLLPAAIVRVRDVVAEYRRAAEALDADRVLAFATSAVREAENGEVFLEEIERSYGFDTRLLSGEDEALLMFRGVVSDRREVAPRTLVVDVGGGSTELVLGGPGGVEFSVSLALGCVRLTERYLQRDPPPRSGLDACAAHVRSLLAAHTPDDLAPRSAIGVAGTVTTLATLHLGLEEEDPELVHGHAMPTSWIATEVDALSRASVAELRRRPGIHRDRAPVLVAGAIVVREALAHFELGELEASERDILDGAALAAAELAPPGRGGSRAV